MENQGTTRALRLVTDDQMGDSPSDDSREEYWTQVQALRAELARLRPAN